MQQGIIHHTRTESDRATSSTCYSATTENWSTHNNKCWICADNRYISMGIVNSKGQLVKQKRSITSGKRERERERTADITEIRICSAIMPCCGFHSHPQVLHNISPAIICCVALFPSPLSPLPSTWYDETPSIFRIEACLEVSHEWSSYKAN